MARRTGRAKPMTPKAGVTKLYNVIRRRRYDNPKENNNPYIQL